MYPPSRTNTILTAPVEQVPQGEFGYLQQAVTNTPIATPSAYPALQGPVPPSPIAGPMVPPIVIFTPPTEVIREAPPRASSKIGRFFDRLVNLVTTPGHPADVQDLTSEQASTAFSSSSSTSLFVAPATSHTRGVPHMTGQPTYEMRGPPATNPEQFSSSRFHAPAAPPSALPSSTFRQPANFAAATAASAPPANDYFSLVDEIRRHAPLDHLQRHGVNANSVQQAGLALVNFYDAGYTLSEIRALFPDYSTLVSIGLNKHLFLSDRWSVRELSALYGVSLGLLVSAQCFGFTPDELAASGLGAPDLAALGITVPALAKAGADFLFWARIGCTPLQFAQLGGTVEHVTALNLNRDQWRVLYAHDWSFKTIQCIPGVSEQHAVKLLPFSMKFH